MKKSLDESKVCLYKDFIHRRMIIKIGEFVSKKTFEFQNDSTISDTLKV